MPVLARRQHPLATGGSAQAGAQRRARMAIGAVAPGLFVAAAWRGKGCHQSDEWFQTIELASFKLGRTPASALPWEFRDRIRPFLQPAVHVALARGAAAAGLSAPGELLLVFRLASALASFGAALLLWAALQRRLADPRRRTMLLAGCTCAFHLPSLGARTSSEAAAGALLAAAVASYLLLQETPRRAGLATGLALGLAFDARDQIGFCAVGVAAWLALVRRDARALSTLAVGFALAAALGLAVDRWGYGAWMPLAHDLTAATAVRALADAEPGRPFAVVGADPFVDEDTGLRRAFLAPAGWSPEPVASWSALEDGLRRDPGPRWVVARLDDGPPPDLRASHRVRLVAAAVPERGARLLASPYARRSLRGLWSVSP